MRVFKALIGVLAGAVMIVGLSGTALAFNSDGSSAYAMYVGDKEVGYVRFPARGLALYDDVINSLHDKYDEEILIDSEVVFKELNYNGRLLTSESNLVMAIEEAVNINVNAYAIVVDGEDVCYVRTIDEAEKIMDAIKDPFIQKIEENENSELEEVEFAQEISFNTQIVPYGDLKYVDEAVEFITLGTEGIVEYEVQDGDSLWSIARAHDIRVADLEQFNPDLEGETIKPGETLNIAAQTNILTVVTKETLVYTREIDFETEIREDNTLLRGNTKVIEEGEKGEMEITAYVTKEDGREVGREIIEEKVAKEPVNRVEVRGTKAPPPPPSRSSSSTSPAPSRPVANRGNATGSAIVAEARRHLGKPYVWAASGPNSFDCSGFTTYVFRQFGITLPRTSVAQRSVGTHVAKSDLRPGDLVLFRNSNHVGIYIGGGQFIHASGTRSRGGRVQIDNLNSGSYSSRYVGARRIV